MNLFIDTLGSMNNIKIYQWMDKLMDGWVDGWMDGWMDGWIKRNVAEETTALSVTAIFFSLNNLSLCILSLKCLR